IRVYPPTVVERWYARGVFPVISAIAGKVADAVPFSWLDVAVPLGLVSSLFLMRSRKWRWLLNLVSILYLIFFWLWALNYHRQPLTSKLELDSARTGPEAMETFSMHAAAEINRLYTERQKIAYEEAGTREEARRRVQRVVQIIDGSDWEAAHRIKTSWISNPWFHAAGVDGM